MDEEPVGRKVKPKPTKDELRAAVEYTRAQFRIMWPKLKPQRRPSYRTVVLKVAQYAADIRKAKQ